MQRGVDPKRLYIKVRQAGAAREVQGGLWLVPTQVTASCRAPAAALWRHAGMLVEPDAASRAASALHRPSPTCLAPCPLTQIASTWEGIRACEMLQDEGIDCNMTLLFSFAQVRRGLGNGALAAGAAAALVA